MGITVTRHPEPAATPAPTKFSEEDAAILLARDWLWEKLPTMSQLALFRREDGAYFCAVEGCGIAGPPEQGKDQLVTIGPLVFCHEHGKAVLKRLRQDFGAGTRDRQCQWHYLSKTVHNAEVRDQRVSEQAAEDGEENKRAAGADAEMKTRAQRLTESRQWAARHIAWVAAKRAEAEADKALTQARQSAAADKPSAEAASDSEPPEPAPDPNNPFLGKSREELDAARARLIQTQRQVEEWEAEKRLTPERAKTEKDKILHALNCLAQAEQFLRREAEKAARAAEKAAQEEARRKSEEVEARLQQLWADLGFKPKPPKLTTSATGSGSAPLVRTDRGTRNRNPHPEAMLAACNVHPEVKGNPVRLTLEFKPENFPDHFACDKALDETGQPWFRHLRDHAPEGAAEDEILRNKSEANEKAKEWAKNCRLHGKEAKELAYFRSQVIGHYVDNWPKAWEERLAAAAAKRNGGKKEAQGLPCANSNCGRQVRQLYRADNGGEPLSMAATDEAGRAAIAAGICGRCKKHGRNVERRVAQARSEKRNSGTQKKGGDGGGGKPKKDKPSKEARDAAKRAARYGR